MEQTEEISSTILRHFSLHSRPVSHDTWIAARLKIDENNETPNIFVRTVNLRSTNTSFRTLNYTTVAHFSLATPPS